MLLPNISNKDNGNGGLDKLGLAYNRGSIPRLGNDDVRQFAYDAIFKIIKSKTSKRILDVGTRDSKFPAYLASIGHKVSICERFKGAIESQRENRRLFNIEYENEYWDDVLNIPTDNVYDIILSTFAIQHNIETDTDCYLYCWKDLLTFGGKMVVIAAYNAEEGKLHLGRSDGDMRICSEEEIHSRIIDPLDSAVSFNTLAVDYWKYHYPIEGQPEVVGFVDKKDASVVMITMEKALDG